MLVAGAWVIFVLHNAAQATEVLKGIWELTQKIQITIDNEDGVREHSIFCHPGQRREWRNLWVKPYLQVEGLIKGLPPTDLVTYTGRSVSDVASRVSDAPYFKRSSSTVSPAEEYLFPPFTYSCICFVSSDSFVVHFQVKNPDVNYVCVAMCGLAVFFFAPSLTRKTLFHYALGITVCMLIITVATLVSCFIAVNINHYYASQIVLVMKFVWNLVEQISSSISFLEVMSEAFKHKYIWVFYYYLGFSALVSYVITRCFIAIFDPHTPNLICWSLQAWGLHMVYRVTQIEEVSQAIIFVVLMLYLYQPSVLRFLKAAWLLL